MLCSWTRTHDRHPPSATEPICAPSYLQIHDRPKTDSALGNTDCHTLASSSRRCGSTHELRNLPIGQTTCRESSHRRGWHRPRSRRPSFILTVHRLFSKPFSGQHFLVGPHHHVCCIAISSIGVAWSIGRPRMPLPGPTCADMTVRFT